MIVLEILLLFLGVNIFLDMVIERKKIPLWHYVLFVLLLVFYYSIT